MSVALPWYGWFASQWLASETRLAMTTSERSVYRDLLDHCYESGSIPDNHAILANMTAVSLEEFNRAWPAVGRKFEPHPDQSGRLVNPRALSEMNKRESKSRAGETGGVRSGERRTKQRNEAGASPENEAGDSHKKRNIRGTADEEHKLQPLCAPDGAHGGDCHSLALTEPQNRPDERESWFIQFWSSYRPIRSRARKSAHKAFMKAVTTEARFREVMTAIEQQTPELLSRDPDKRPYGSSWLNGARWEDEMTELASQANSATGGAIARAIASFKESHNGDNHD